MDETANEKWGNPDIFSNKKFPFTHDNPLENYDLSSIHSYVQNVLSQVTNGESMLSTDVFETHHWVIAKIKIPNQLLSRNLKIWVNANRIKIERTQDNKAPIVQILNLPCRVDPYTRKAVFRKDILEIRMPKVKYKDRYHEVIF
jgi:HSP20 family molecular chaperone IbpA